MRRRSGFTLVETLIAVIIVSILSLMAFPRVNSAVSKSNVRAARTRLVNMFAAARAAATQNSRTAAYVEFNGNTAVITASPRRTVGGAGTRDTIGGAVNLNTVYGATLSTTITTITYDPRGLATGFSSGGQYIKVTKGSYADSIKIDQLGRVTK
jgi:prepilin-type N-terminal cleavage/methylation domain-containing protein